MAARVANLYPTWFFVNFFCVIRRSRTYTVAWSVSERHERLLLIVTAKESFWDEDACIKAPVFRRSVQVQIRKVDQHARLGNHGLLAGGELDFAVDDSKCSVDSGV